jgi:putative endonuclease
MFNWLRNLFPVRGPRAAARGEAGERLAEDFLRRERGWVIVARNWRAPRDRRAEIDLVARDGEALVFVEVKTRATGALVPGYYAVTARKKRAVRRACLAYLALLPRRPRAFRFDVVEVALPGPMDPAEVKPVVRHFANIPLFPKHYTG